jgi:hypothetical protein
MFPHTIVLIVVYPLTVIAMFQQSAVNDKMWGACGEAGTPYVRKDPPVVHGKPYVVPTLRLRVVDAQTGKPIVGRELMVHYVWRWYEYSHEGHVLGVWSDVSIPRKCTTDQEGFLSVPEFRITPHGWYKGKLLLWRKPEFTHLSVTVDFHNFTNRFRSVSFRIDKTDINRYQEADSQFINLRVSP